LVAQLGKNPTSFVFGTDGEPQPLQKGQQVELENGDRFMLFVDHTYTVQTRTDKAVQVLSLLCSALLSRAYAYE